MQTERIAVLDFGGQYAHLIATRVRDRGVLAEIVQPDGFVPRREDGWVGVIFSGGPHSVTQTDHPTIGFDPCRVEVPVLGLCYGHQLLARVLGGTVEAGANREFGAVAVTCDGASRLFSGLPERQSVWMSHGDHVTRLPDGARATARSDQVEIAAFESADGRLFGLQFHPEVTHTEHGSAILDRFLDVCRAPRNWTPGLLHHRIVDQIRARAAGRRLILFVSGGVDSLVCLALCLEALPADRIVAIHVDTGLMREGESKEVVSHLASIGFTGLEVVDASERFYGSLAGVHEPEAKRLVIGRGFVEVLQHELSSRWSGGDGMLVQGTIYPDRIESGATRHAARIKTHHNRVPEIERLMAEGRVLEPICELYKDEVRKLGLELGLPPALLERHPFPGPGLGVRVLCSPTDEAEAGYDREGARLAGIAEGLGLASRILPVRSVGVQGDGRSYLHPAVVWPSGRAVEFDDLLAAARRIVNELSTVNRVVFSATPLEGPVRLVRAFVDPGRVAALRRVDRIAREYTRGEARIWQMPVVSLPAVDAGGRPLFVIRPIVSTDAMTADVYPMGVQRLVELSRLIERECGPAVLLYDLTSKPPATIEWE